MNSESVKELLKWHNSVLVCGHGKRKSFSFFTFLTSSGGSFYKFFMTIALAIPPLTMKTRTVRLIGLGWLNTFLPRAWKSLTSCNSQLLNAQVPSCHEKDHHMVSFINTPAANLVIHQCGTCFYHLSSQETGYSPEEENNSIVSKISQSVLLMKICKEEDQHLKTEVTLGYVVNSWKF